MDKKMNFKYFYGTEADQFSFYRIPKALFTNECFKDLSSDAKILYGLMLDRMSLSIKNQWFDEENRAYIYFSIEDIMELLNCGRNKAVKSLQELDDEKGIGLIEKRRQGFGKVTIIYVKSFIQEGCEEQKKEKSKMVKFTNQTSVEEEETEEVYISNFKKSQKQTSRNPENKLQEVYISNSNNTNINNTNLSENKSNHIVSADGIGSEEDMIINRRDHRKLTIIDGQVGYSGGLNLADEYINKNSPYGKWKDTGYCLEGHAVDYMTKAFLEMWNLDSTVREDTKNYLGAKGREGEGLIQPYFSSPTDGRFTAEGAYLTLIHQSKKYIHIITPYLIIDDTMISALCLAAKSGVEVVIITPGIPDKKMVYLVTKSYYPVLLEAGVRIYEYTPGFTHAKMCVSDGKIAIVGSVNLDYRSLYQHYEGGCVFYHNKIVNEVESDLQDVIKECHMVSREEIEKERKSVRILQKVLRLIAPVM